MPKKFGGDMSELFRKTGAAWNLFNEQWKGRVEIGACDSTSKDTWDKSFNMAWLRSTIDPKYMADRAYNPKRWFDQCPFISKIGPEAKAIIFSFRVKEVDRISGAKADRKARCKDHRIGKAWVDSRYRKKDLITIFLNIAIDLLNSPLDTVSDLVCDWVESAAERSCNPI